MTQTFPPAADRFVVTATWRYDEPTVMTMSLQAAVDYRRAALRAGALTVEYVPSAR